MALYSCLHHRAYSVDYSRYQSGDQFCRNPQPCADSRRFLARIHGLTPRNGTAKSHTRHFKTRNFRGLIWTIVAIILFPAICEEIAFRGVLHPLGRITKNVHLSIWITAFIFSFIHFQFYGFLPRMVLGALFGYMVSAGLVGFLL